MIQFGQMPLGAIASRAMPLLALVGAIAATPPIESSGGGGRGRPNGHYMSSSSDARQDDYYARITLDDEELVELMSMVGLLL